MVLFTVSSANVHDTFSLIHFQRTVSKYSGVPSMLITSLSSSTGSSIIWCINLRNKGLFLQVHGLFLGQAYSNLFKERNKHFFMTVVPVLIPLALIDHVTSIDKQFCYVWYHLLAWLLQLPIFQLLQTFKKELLYAFWIN